VRAANQSFPHTTGHGCSTAVPQLPSDEIFDYYRSKSAENLTSLSCAVLFSTRTTSQPEIPVKRWRIVVARARTAERCRRAIVNEIVGQKYAEIGDPHHRDGLQTRNW